MITWSEDWRRVENSLSINSNLSSTKRPLKTCREPVINSTPNLKRDAQRRSKSIKLKYKRWHKNTTNKGSSWKPNTKLREDNLRNKSNLSSARLQTWTKKGRSLKRNFPVSTLKQLTKLANTRMKSLVWGTNWLPLMNLYLEKEKHSCVKMIN